MPKKAITDRQDNTADLLLKLFEKSDRVLVKKLSNNDRDWAYNPDKHQAGVYIPVKERDGGFFPLLAVKSRSEGAKEIREVFFETTWPQVDWEGKKTRLVNYRSKREETHMTRVPKDAFSDLLPASFIVMGRLGKHPHRYECLTIDSGSDEAILLSELFYLEPDFQISEFDPSEVKGRERERILDFADQVIDAWLKGGIVSFARENATMPETQTLAKMARDFFVKKYGGTINPFELDAPGDALREISRSIEWDLFREYQRRERSVDLVRILLGDKAKNFTAKDFIRQLVDQFQGIDAILLSASQQRKSRAGTSYEHHIEAMLLAGKIPFGKQVVIEAKKRPDFVLPSIKFIDGDSPNAKTGLILSAKTTLRERWKQVEREKGKRRLYLTTVDQNIAGNAIGDMASMGIYLVVPESLMDSDRTEYLNHENVITFKQFCTNVVAPNLKQWS